MLAAEVAGPAPATAWQHRDEMGFPVMYGCSSWRKGRRWGTGVEDVEKTVVAGEIGIAFAITIRICVAYA